MSNLQVFSNTEFGQIRTTMIDGQPFFVGKDVAEILGYANTRDAISRHVDNEDKGVAKCDTLGGGQELNVINESGLYSLILASKLPGAKRFKRWVTAEVLPSIRKSGGYISGQENLSDDQLIAKALIVAQRQLDERNRRIEEMRPKEIFADAVSASHSSIIVGELAKLISQNGINIGQNRLFAWMRENGYLIRKQGSSYNMPTQRSMEQGLFEIKERSITNGDGSIRVTKTPVVTGKGQVYFINKFLE